MLRVFVVAFVMTAARSVAVHAAELLRNTHRVTPSRIFIRGHGLGGFLAPRIGMLDPRLAGLVLLAASTRSTREYDPVSTAASLQHFPLLIVHGERDDQVSDEDFAGWSKIGSRTNVTLLRLPELNHLMIEGGADAPGHVDVRVIDAIETFVKR